MINNIRVTNDFELQHTLRYNSENASRCALYKILKILESAGAAAEGGATKVFKGDFFPYMRI